MTVSELLALLGLAWWRLFVYPGGIALLGAFWLATRTANREPQQFSVVRGATLVALIAPWLALALLPLPGTRPLTRPLDIFIALALLDAPLFVAVAAALQAADGQWQPSVRRLAALNGYPVVILACALLSSDSLTFDGLAQMPDSADARGTATHWFGAVTLLLALPALLNLGPFAVPGTQPVEHTENRAAPHRVSWKLVHTGLWLRAIGFMLIAALPWLPLLGERTWLAPLPPMLIAALLWGIHRIAANGSVRRWGWCYVVLALIQLLVLLVRDALMRP